MSRYSQLSKARLDTCHKDLRTLFNQVVPHFDNSILCGHRGEAEQMAAFNAGKSKLRWPAGKHNSAPSMAVDALPYPIDWKDLDRMRFFAGYVLGVAAALHADGLMTHRVRWGGDWNMDTMTHNNGFDDLAHFELVT